jgi:hypothetical protein
VLTGAGGLGAASRRPPGAGVVPWGAQASGGIIQGGAWLSLSKLIFHFRRLP